jgi:hypothetical protein
MAKQLIEKLQSGESVKFRPHGNSMQGRIESGQLVTVTPVNPEEIEVGDVVFCKVKGRRFCHLVTAKQDGRFQISNNKGFVNGWVGPNSIYGKVTSIED